MWERCARRLKIILHDDPIKGDSRIQYSLARCR